MVIAAIRRNRHETVTADVGERRTAALARFADLELVRVVARDDTVAADTHGDGAAPGTSVHRPAADREVKLRVVHAERHFFGVFHLIQATKV